MDRNGAANELFRAGKNSEFLPGCDCSGTSAQDAGRAARLIQTPSINPSKSENRPASCAFVSPNKDFGLMRMNSTRKRARPVRIKKAAKTEPGLF
jgi:hypothetical protein